MNMKNPNIGCIVMASGRSERYGRDKLLEALGDREIILHAAGCLIAAGLAPVVVARSPAVKALLDGAGVRCVLHDGARKSDTMHVGIACVGAEVAGYLFMPGDQPLTRPASIRKLVEQFGRCPARAVRLGFGDAAGGPVLFPASFREDLLAYAGDRGGMEVLRAKNAPCDVVQADFDWELWDVDTPESMESVRRIYERLCQN